MWIFARLLFALLLALARAIRGRRVRVQETHGLGDAAWVLRQRLNGRSRRGAFSFGVPCRCPVFLHLSTENKSDRLFKYLGFAREVQTGDADFDREIYIACDHPAFAPLLADRALRNSIRYLFRAGVTGIHTDGRHLWARHPDNNPANEARLDALRALRDALARVPDADWQALRDPFVWRALVAETATWSLAIYGLLGLLELLADPRLRYFHYLPIATAGIGVGLAYLVLFLLGLRQLLGRSSRSALLFSECAILLVPGLLWLGFENTSEANRDFDRSAAIELRPLVTKRYTETRNHRGREYTSYYLRLSAENAYAATLLPHSLSVTHSFYHQTAVGRPLLIRIREGALGFEWVESIQAPPTNTRPPTP